MFELTTMTAEDFSALKGTEFTTVSLDTEIKLELMEIKKLGQGERSGGAYSLLWQGPTSPILPQATYRIFQEQIGEHDFFLVPVAEKDAGIQYEAVFT